jgi:hypothetical protein
MFHPVQFGVAATLAFAISPGEALAGPTSVANASVVGLSTPVEAVAYCAKRHRHRRQAYQRVRRVYHYVYGASAAPVVTTIYPVYDDPYYYNYSYGRSYPYYSAWSSPIYWGGGWGYRRSWGGWGGGYHYRPFGGAWGGGFHHRPWGGGWGGGTHSIGHWGGGGFGGGRPFGGGGFHHGGWGGGHFGGFHHGGGWGGGGFHGGGFRGGGFGFRGH